MRTASHAVLVLLVGAAFTSPARAQRAVSGGGGGGGGRAAPVHVGTPHGGQQGDSDWSGNPLGCLSVVAAVVVVVLIACAWRNRTVAHVRIIGLPPGEAPAAIRRAWVGVELPLRSREREPRPLRTVGILSSEDPEISTGFAVEGRKAVQALAARSPEAAAWWRENAPQVVAAGFQMFFPVEVCERVR